VAAGVAAECLVEPWKEVSGVQLVGNRPEAYRASGTLTEDRRLVEAERRESIENALAE
jgi:hypothetical protein